MKQLRLQLVYCAIAIAGFAGCRLASVRFEAVLKPTFTQCMAGEVIELISIERLE
ncbi:MAG TPA: hypothetical protein VNJ04_04845 [Gemmatimonadaceae bacterium]|nr:hypothetical protein [Gemmatimonadaceae bacterium]